MLPKMSKQKPQKYSSLNLLTHPHTNFLDTFLGWALTVGRFMIILTETIALVVFLYRFGLDENLVELHGDIKNDQAILNQMTSYETSFRNLQFRLQTIKN